MRWRGGSPFTSSRGAGPGTRGRAGGCGPGGRSPAGMDGHLQPPLPAMGITARYPPRRRGQRAAAGPSPAPLRRRKHRARLRSLMVKRGPSPLMGVFSVPKPAASAEFRGITPSHRVRAAQGCCGPAPCAARAHGRLPPGSPPTGIPSPSSGTRRGPLRPARSTAGRKLRGTLSRSLAPLAPGPLLPSSPVPPRDPLVGEQTQRTAYGNRGAITSTPRGSPGGPRCPLTPRASPVTPPFALPGAGGRAGTRRARPRRLLWGVEGLGSPGEPTTTTRIPTDPRTSSATAGPTVALRRRITVLAPLCCVTRQRLGPRSCADPGGQELGTRSHKPSSRPWPYPG